jgi:hypothetical protein
MVGTNGSHLARPQHVLSEINPSLPDRSSSAGQGELHHQAGGVSIGSSRLSDLG